MSYAEAAGGLLALQASSYRMFNCRHVMHMSLTDARLLCRRPQVLALGQEVAFEYQGVSFVLRVNNLMVLDRKHTQMSVTRGLLVRDASLTYEAQNHTNIKARALQQAWQQGGGCCAVVSCACRQQTLHWKCWLAGCSALQFSFCARTASSWRQRDLSH